MKEKKKIITIRMPLDDYREIVFMTCNLNRSVSNMIRFMLWTWPAVMAEHCKILDLKPPLPRLMEGLAIDIRYNRKKALEKSKPRNEGAGKILAFPGK